GPSGDARKSFVTAKDIDVDRPKQSGQCLSLPLGARKIFVSAWCSADLQNFLTMRRDQMEAGFSVTETPSSLSHLRQARCPLDGAPRYARERTDVAGFFGCRWL